MRGVAKVGLPLLVIALGVVGTVVLIKNRPEVKRAPVEERGVAVDVVEATLVSRPVVVHAHGTVHPSREVVVQPQVGGMIVELGPDLVPGGRVKAGDLVARVDPADYRVAVTRAEAEVEHQRFNLEMEEGRKTVADREWKLLGDKKAAGDRGRSFALREPHIRNAKASLDAARSGLTLARLNLDRTRITAPFNAVVLQELAEEGLVVSPATRLATLVGTDAWWVEVAVPASELRWIDVPTDPRAASATATVVFDTGEMTVRRKGTVTRMLPDLTPTGRLPRLIVEIADPLGLESGGATPPLLLGAFVEVEIEGRRLDRVIELPRAALREDGRVWAASADDKLVIKRVEVARRNRATVLVRSGIEPGERVIVSSLSAPLPDMKLRPRPSTEPAVGEDPSARAAP